MRMSENRKHRSKFGLKRNRVTRDLRKMHNEGFRNLYASPNIIRMITPMGMRWTVHLARKKENMRWYKILDGNLEGKRSLERSIR
jgi:hypothetical protein